MKDGLKFSIWLGVAQHCALKELTSLVAVLRTSMKGNDKVQAAKDKMDAGFEFLAENVRLIHCFTRGLADEAEEYEANLKEIAYAKQKQAETGIKPLGTANGPVMLVI